MAVAAGVEVTGPICSRTHGAARLADSAAPGRAARPPLDRADYFLLLDRPDDARRERIETRPALAEWNQLTDAAVPPRREGAAAPGVRVLATSREPLRLGAEHVCPVQPLTMPELDGNPLAPKADAQRQYEALALFEERASAVVPEFALNRENQTAVTRLCRRLDGLPLAIELAAVWLRTLSVDQILDRMEDRYRLLARGSRTGLPRHKTLRATVEWSFQLCTELERTLWRRLSVFAGGIDLEAAEYVCVADDLTADDVVFGLAGLVDKSVLSRVEGDARTRYVMLETIREYGRERLADSGDDVAVRRRHRDHYMWLAEESEAQWFGPRQRAWLDRFRAAYDRGKRLAFDAAVAYALGDAADTPPAAPEAPADSAGPRLTRGEHEVAGLVANGRSNKEIATSLVISQRTAENHVEHILVKLGFTRRTQIATWIAEHQHRARG